MNADKFIPQRYPFKMTDNIDDVLPGQEADATKLLNINEWYFNNQEENPVMPRSIAIEALAQTGAVSILSMPKYAGHNAFFGGIKKAEFKDDLRPGDLLHLNVQMLKLKRNIGIGRGKIIRNHQVICQADLIFAVE